MLTSYSEFDLKGSICLNMHLESLYIQKLLESPIIHVIFVMTIDDWQFVGDRKYFCIPMWQCGLAKCGGHISGSYSHTAQYSTVQCSTAQYSTVTLGVLCGDFSLDLFTMTCCSFTEHLFYSI